MKKEEMISMATQTLAKAKFKLKKASPTIMVFGAAVTGIAAIVAACNATRKADAVVKEHQKEVIAIHESQETADNAVQEEETKKALTKVYVQTGIKLAKIYAPTITLEAISLGCMFGSHSIMHKRNASLTAAYVALDKAFVEYKNRVTDRFGGKVQHELEQNIKTITTEEKKTNENGTEELVQGYKDISAGANDPYSLVFDETISTWEKDPMLNQVTLNQALANANRRLRTNGHLFLNEVIDMIDSYGKGSHHTPIGQVVGWIYDPNDMSRSNCVDFGLLDYVVGNDALNSFIDGEERSVVIHFNCDGPIIDKI